MALRRLADRIEDVTVEQAMRSGWGWPEVAEALGVTRQAVTPQRVGACCAS